MKYAFMTYSCPDQNWDGVLETAKRYGYDGVELRASSKQAHGLEFDLDAAGRREAKDKAAQAGIDICCLAVSCRFSDPATLQSAIEDTHRGIDLAADLGCDRLRVFGGVIAEKLSRDDAVVQVVHAMRQLKDYAAQHRVTICFETHDDWCHPTDLLRIVETLNHPNIRINWDMMHPIYTTGLSLEESFELVRPWVAHVHMHDCIRQDGERVLVPIGEGMVDHRRTIELLKSIDYAGYISDEWIRWKPAEEHLAQELATMKKYEQEIH